MSKSLSCYFHRTGCRGTWEINQWHATIGPLHATLWFDNLHDYFRDKNTLLPSKACLCRTRDEGGSGNRKGPDLLTLSGRSEKLVETMINRPCRLRRPARPYRTYRRGHPNGGTYGSCRDGTDGSPTAPLDRHVTSLCVRSRNVTAPTNTPPGTPASPARRPVHASRHAFRLRPVHRPSARWALDDRSVPGGQPCTTGVPVDARRPVARGQLRTCASCNLPFPLRPLPRRTHRQPAVTPGHVALRPSRHSGWSLSRS